MSNFNPVNIGLLLIGVLLIYSGVTGKSFSEAVKGLASGSGFDGGGGLGANGGGSW